MSFFHAEILVPKNTQSETPQKSELEIQFGVIHRIQVVIPSGHGGLTGIHILQGLHQIAPTSGSEWFSGDDLVIEYDEFIEVESTPFSLSVEAYNTDDTYAHTFRIGVGVLPKYVLLPQVALANIMSGVSDILAGMAKWLGVKTGG